MRKRLLSILLCFVMVTGLFPTVAFAADETADGPAAQVGDRTYATLEEAIDTASEGDTITLLRDDAYQHSKLRSFNLTGKTLDLNGKNYSIAVPIAFCGDNGTIKNGAVTLSFSFPSSYTLTIQGSSPQDLSADGFTLDNVKLNNGLYISHGTDVRLKDVTVTEFGTIESAVVLSEGCSATIESGSYTIDGNSTSAVQNNGGTLTIEGGTFFASGNDAVAVLNGTRDQSKNHSSTTTINDGSFTTKGSGYLLWNWSNLTINGGTFSGEGKLLSDSFSSANTTINDGFFSLDGYLTDNRNRLQVNGGYYNRISDWDVSDGRTVILSDVPGYQYQVVKKNNDVSVVVDDSNYYYDYSKLSDDLNEYERYQLKSMSCSVDVLEAAAREIVAQQLGDTEIAELKAQAMDKLNALTTNAVYLYVNSYLYFAPISMKDNLLSMEITPKYEIWASTNSNVWYFDEYIPDAYKLKDAQPLSIEKPVTVSITLPIGFVDGSEKIYIEHQKDGQKYIYDGTLKQEQRPAQSLTDGTAVVLAAPSIDVQSNTDQYYLEFTTYHGFSPFAVTQTAPAAKAEGMKFGFDNLQSAADNANGSTVVLYSGDAHELTLDGTIKAARQTVKNASDTVMTITFNGEDFELPAGETRTFAVAPVIVENGSSSGAYIAGKRVDIKADTKDGYTFSEWTSEPSVAFDAAKSAETYFIMPDTAVKVTANYTKNADPVVPDDNSGSSSGGGSGSSSRSYSVSIASSEHGTVSANLKNAAPGATVVLTPTPADGCKLASLAVFDKNGKQIALTLKDGKYTFIMPASGVEIKAVFAAQQDMPFTDVKQGNYFYDAVQWAVDNGITTGVSDMLFGTDAACTRAQAVTFLWRVAGSPEPKSADSFADVPEDSYYAKAVAWAVENGIVNGVSATEFAPDATCTRAQIVTLLWRAEKTPAVDAEISFTDVGSDAYYTDAVQWALKNGITNGTSASTFSPDASCTRAQIVTFLWRTLAE